MSHPDTTATAGTQEVGVWVERPDPKSPFDSIYGTPYSGPGGLLRDPEFQSLDKAIDANYGDDLPQEVLADWLEERGFLKFAANTRKEIAERKQARKFTAIMLGTMDAVLAGAKAIKDMTAGFTKVATAMAPMLSLFYAAMFPPTIPPGRRRRYRERAVRRYMRARR